MIRFAHLPPNSLLSLVPLDDDLETVREFRDHVEVSLRAQKMFEELSAQWEVLAKAVASLNMVRRKGKPNAQPLPLLGSAYIPSETNFGEKAYKDARLTGDFSRQSHQIVSKSRSAGSGCPFPPPLHSTRRRPQPLSVAPAAIRCPATQHLPEKFRSKPHRNEARVIEFGFMDPVTPGACQRVARLLVPGPFRPQVTIHGPSTVQSHHFWQYQGFHLMDWHAQILTHTAVEVVAHEISETPPKSSPPIAWKLDSRFTVPLVKMTFLMVDVQRVMYDTPHCALADFVPTQRSGRQPSGFGTRVWRRSGTSEIWKGANVGSNPAMSIDRLIRSEFEWDGPNKRVGLIRPDGADLDLGN
ncbi:hypothetical protein B0H11DRAFT_2187531 [Mycena galericulata]|nr:hypothetical protein B0H11DRAFT_2187531 [Mycena galericulata]